MIINLTVAPESVHYCSSCFGVVFTVNVDALANAELSTCKFLLL